MSERPTNGNILPGVTVLPPFNQAEEHAGAPRGAMQPPKRPARHDSKR